VDREEVIHSAPVKEKVVIIRDLSDQWLLKEFATFQSVASLLWSSAETTRSEEIHKVVAAHGLLLHEEMQRRGLAR
jgi:hypothetical protein